MSFYISTEAVGLFVNGNAWESNIHFEPVGENAMGNTPEDREQWRRNNYNLYGGDGFVVEYLFQNAP
ncbi:hypothetical protein AB3N59_02070 [Leptospira sp. WS92.C1]